LLLLLGREAESVPGAEILRFQQKKHGALNGLVCWQILLERTAQFDMQCLLSLRHEDFMIHSWDDPILGRRHNKLTCSPSTEGKGDAQHVSSDTDSNPFGNLHEIHDLTDNHNGSALATGDTHGDGPGL
jgi:hypothetical protein